MSNRFFFVKFDVKNECFAKYPMCTQKKELFCCFMRDFFFKKNKVSNIELHFMN